jgi:hypothetical protein
MIADEELEQSFARSAADIDREHCADRKLPERRVKRQGVNRVFAMRTDLSTFLPHLAAF